MTETVRKRKRVPGDLEILLREYREEPDEPVRMNLLRRIRSLQRQGYGGSALVLCVALVRVQRALLLDVRGLRGVEAVNAVVRLSEQATKLGNALKRVDRHMQLGRMGTLVRSMPWNNNNAGDVRQGEGDVD